MGSILGAALLSGTGMIGKGLAAGQQASYQAQVANNNAIIEKQNAAYAASAGAAHAEQSGLQERERLAQLRAGIAANGLDVNSGTPADLQESQHVLGSLNTRTASNNAALETYGYESKATGFTAEGKIKKAEATFDRVSGFVNAAASLAGNPDVTSAAGFGGGSQLSGNPSVGSGYQWMQSGSRGDPYALGGTSDGGFVD